MDETDKELLEEKRKAYWREYFKALNQQECEVFKAEKEKERIYWEEEHPKILQAMTIKPMEFFEWAEEERKKEAKDDGI